MKPIHQKFIASILIIGLILSLNLNLIFLKPKQAKALDGGGSIAQFIKEIALDAAAWALTDVVIARLVVKIRDWGMGRESDAMEPFAVTDFLKYFKYRAAIGAAEFIAEYDAIWDLSDNFDRGVKQALDSLGFGTNLYDLPSYRYYARPTLRNDMGANYDNFVNSGYSMRAGGWDGWFSLMKPQNNIFGQIMMAAAAKRKYIEAQEKAGQQETAVSGGYRNEMITELTDAQTCEEGCAMDYPRMINVFPAGQIPNPDFQQCMQDRGCDSKPGIPIQQRIKNLGSDIHKSMQDAVGKDLARMITADEISELVGVLFSALLNKAINGLGLLFSPKRTDSTTAARAEYQQKYTYLRDFKKEQTSEDRTDMRSNVLQSTLNAVQQISRSIIACDHNEMMKQEDYAKNIADVFDAQVEGLYIGIEGANLKPDFEVLDPRFAPYSVYGYSWGNVPSVKFPAKCRKITDQLTLGPNATCRWISSGLEPNFDPNCEQCMYDHDSLNCPPEPYPPQPYPTTGTEPWTLQEFQQKSNFYNSCRGPYNTVLDRCEDCVKRADEKCVDLLDPTQRDQCIQNYCNNYGNLSTQVVQPIVDGLDFYNKCLIEEKKEACYTCLREYFMPATYCEQMKDYMARSIVKYPAVVILPRSWLQGDTGMFIGPYDDAVADMGGECNDNHNAQSIDVSLICRIMPEYEYLGQQICRTMCSDSNSTPQQWEEMLRDTTDFRPNSRDCNRARIPIGGQEPWATISDGLMHIRSKCCADAWQHDIEKYGICVGSGPVADTEPPENDEAICGNVDENGLAGPGALPFYEAPQFCCGEGFRPVTQYFNTREGLPRYYCNWNQLQFGPNNFTVPNSGEIYVCSNTRTGGASMFIASGTCGQKNTCRDGQARGSSFDLLYNDNPISLSGPRVIGVSGPLVQCSDHCSGDCLTRSNENTACEEIWETTEGNCNPCGRAPDGILCSIETDRINGSEKMKCNLANATSSSLYFSLWLDQLDDIIEKWDDRSQSTNDWSIGGQACMKCECTANNNAQPGDPGCPYYGYQEDQCFGKSVLNRRRCGQGDEGLPISGNDADLSCTPGATLVGGTALGGCQCDDNADCTDAAFPICDGCNCVAGGQQPVCGDGAVEVPEICEPPDIGCAFAEECLNCTACIPLSGCGDGIVDPGLGEECEPETADLDCGAGILCDPVDCTCNFSF